MKYDDFAISAELEKQLVTQIQQVFATQSTEPLQQFLNQLVETLHIDPIELAAALFYQDAATLAACAQANAKAIQIVNDELPLIPEDSLIRDPLRQQITAILKPTELKPEKIKMVRYRLEVGRKHDVSIEDIKNILINESGVERTKIGYMDIRNHYTLIDLPNGMPTDIFHHLQSVEIKQQMLQIKRVGSSRKRQWQRRNNTGKNRLKDHEESKLSM